MFNNQRWIDYGAPSLPFTLYQESSQAQGLVGWWPFFASGGLSTLRDFSVGAMVDGVVNGAVWISDSVFKQSLQFSGAGNYVDTNVDTIGGVNLFCDSSETFSVTFWANLHANSQGGIVGKEQASNTQFFIFARGGANEDIGLILRDGSITGLSNIIVDNTGWRHHAFTWDGITAKYYIDGRDEGTTITPGTSTSTTGTIYFGDRRAGTGFPLDNGEIGEIRIYNRALTPIEIYYHYAPSSRWELYKPIMSSILTSVPAMGILGLPKISKNHPSRNVILRL